MQRVMVAGLAIAIIGLAGCSNVTAGTPIADPDQTGISTPSTTSRTPSTTRPSTPASPSTPVSPSSPSSPASPTGAPGIPPPAGMANTTCGEYVTMDEATKRQVISAIGEHNELIGMNPELWVGIADMMCSFADKATPVEEAVTGQGPG